MLHNGCSFWRPLIVDSTSWRRNCLISWKIGTWWNLSFQIRKEVKHVHFVTSTTTVGTRNRPVMASHCNRIFVASSINWRRSSHWPDTAAALPNAFNATRSGSKCLSNESWNNCPRSVMYLIHQTWKDEPTTSKLTNVGFQWHACGFKDYQADWLELRGGSTQCRTWS